GIRSCAMYRSRPKRCWPAARSRRLHLRRQCPQTDRPRARQANPHLAVGLPRSAEVRGRAGIWLLSRSLLAILIDGSFADMKYLLKHLPLGASAGVAAGLAVLVTPVAAGAQAESDEARLRRIESEVRALQREVFPGGDGRFFTPEITAPTQSNPTVGTPSQGVLTDILARLDSLETQLARLTSRAEESEHRMGMLEEQIASGVS